MKPHFSVPFYLELLRRTFRDVVQPNQQRFQESRLYSVLMRSLTSVAQVSPQTRKALLSALVSDELQDILQCFLTTSISTSPAEVLRAAACAQASLDMRMQLGLVTCSLLLKSAVAAQAEGHVIALSTIWLLLDKQQEFARQLSPCGHSTEVVRQAPKISLAQLEGTPNVQVDSHDWRARLAAEFQTEAKLHHETTVRTVDQICRDLEERCKDAEAPFREEQRRRKEVQDQCDEISKHAADLEAQAIDQHLYLEALEKEKLQIQADLGAVQSDNDDLSEEATELRRHLKEAHQQAERQVAALSAQHMEKEMEFRTVVAAKISSIEEHERIVREMAKDKAATQAELQSVRQELDEVRGNHDLVSKKLSEVEHSLSVDNTRLVDMEAQLQVLKAEKAEMSALRKQTQGKLDATNAQLSALNEKYEGLLVSSREEMETLAYKHQKVLHTLNEQASNSNCVIHSIQLMDNRRPMQQLNMRKSCGGFTRKALSSDTRTTPLASNCKRKRRRWRS